MGLPDYMYNRHHHHLKKEFKRSAIDSIQIPTNPGVSRVAL